MGRPPALSWLNGKCALFFSISTRYAVRAMWEPKRPYQWQQDAARRAQTENLIVNVDTGCGKTLVALLAIGEALRRDPGRKCAFVVPTSRLLAHQQFERVRFERLTLPWEQVVGRASGGGAQDTDACPLIVRGLSEKKRLSDRLPHDEAH